MKKIELTQGYEAIVDDDDFEELNKFKWFANVGKWTVYASRKNKKGSVKKYEHMHRKILNVKDVNCLVDHIDGNGLNNQRNNLRLCCNSENQHNKKLQVNNKSGFKGVSWYKRDQKWVANITINRKQKHLGYFINPVDAALAYNNAALKLFGQFALINKIETK